MTEWKPGDHGFVFTLATSPRGISIGLYTGGDYSIKGTMPYSIMIHTNPSKFMCKTRAEAEAKL